MFVILVGLFVILVGLFVTLVVSLVVLVVIWVAVGGRGSLAGAILGALSVNLLYDYFTSEHHFGIFTWKAEYWQFVLGLLFIGVVLIFPRGIIQFYRSFTGEKNKERPLSK